MADGMVLDLYAEDLNKDVSVENQKDEFGGDGVDLYDHIGGPSDTAIAGDAGGTLVCDGTVGTVSSDGSVGGGPNGIHHQLGDSLNPAMGHRYHLYVGNLTWWTTDQDISNAAQEIGVNDLQEVKFFENRVNGQSKGFCVISLGSEPSLRVVLEQLPKKKLHGLAPVVTYPSKQAFTQFESLQKTRRVPPIQQNGPHRGPAPPTMSVGSPMQPHPGGLQGMPPGHPSRMLNPNMPPEQYRPQHMAQIPLVGPNAGPPHMQFQGSISMPVCVAGSGLDWSRPSIHGGFLPQVPPGDPQQGPPHMQRPPRRPPQMLPGPDVNPIFYNQPGGLPQHPCMRGPPHDQPGPQAGMNIPPQYGPPPHFAQQGPRGIQLTEVEFEEVMSRNRAVSSCAIARAVSDVTVGEYSSALETLVIAISLIRQSNVAHDERCKILISSLQDTLHGIEKENYNRRLRARERTFRNRQRRERLSSRYRERPR